MSRFQMRTMTLERASPALAHAVAWTRERSRREQIMIAFFGGLLLATLFWFAIPRPLLEARADAIDRIAAYETIQGRIVSAGAGGAAVAPLPDGPLESVIAIQSATFGVTPTNVAVDGDDVRVTVSGARYDAVVPWLAALEGSGQVQIVEARMTRGQAEGTVDMTMTVRRL